MIEQSQMRELFSEFKTPPFLFIGSGLSRRYYSTPDWEGLLRSFANQISGDDYGYPAYKNRCTVPQDDGLFLPSVASLIERDYNEAFYTNKSSDWETRRVNFQLKKMHDDISPFKFAVAQLFKEADFIPLLSLEYKEELELLKKMAAKCVGGIVTTNYDMLIQRLFPDFTAYNSQEDMLFSNSQDIGEIYKIHGCCNNPRSIIINENDYRSFNAKSTYLAAKLLTIFVERPIIFIGYSMSDVNIKTIMNAIVGGLAQHQISTLEKRLLYVNYVDEPQKERIINTSREYDNGTVFMTELDLFDFRPLFKCISTIQYRLNTRLLRHIKEQVTELIRVTAPNSTIQVVDIDDTTSLEKVEFAVGVGIMATLAKRGLIGLSAKDFYRDIIDNSLCTDKVTQKNMPDIVSLSIPLVLKSSPCPIWKYITMIGDTSCLHGNIQKQILKEHAIDGFRTSTQRQCIRSARSSRVDEYRRNNFTIGDLRKQLRSAYSCIDWVLYLKDDCIFKDELLSLIKDVYAECPYIFEAQCTGFKKLIRIYDFLEYHK